VDTDERVAAGAAVHDHLVADRFADLDLDRDPRGRSRRRRAAQVLGPHPENDLAALRSGAAVKGSGAAIANPAAATRLPRSSSVAATRFIGMLPMKPATKTFCGRR
jgi:hypothetical protein